MLRVSPVRGYDARMLQTDHDAKVKLSLPPHVAEVLTGWAVSSCRRRRRKCWRFWRRSSSATSSCGRSRPRWSPTKLSPVPDENAAVAEAEQVVSDHRDRLKAVMLMEVRLFKWDFELLDNEPPEIVAMGSEQLHSAAHVIPADMG